MSSATRMDTLQASTSKLLLKTTLLQRFLPRATKTLHSKSRSRGYSWLPDLVVRQAELEEGVRGKLQVLSQGVGRLVVQQVVVDAWSVCSSPEAHTACCSIPKAFWA